MVCPILTKKHKEYRVKLCKEWIRQKLMWEYVIFSDGKRFNLDGPDGYSYYWHNVNKEELSRLKRQNGVDLS